MLFSVLTSYTVLSAVSGLFIRFSGHQPLHLDIYLFVSSFLLTLFWVVPDRYLTVILSYGLLKKKLLLFTRYMTILRKYFCSSLEVFSVKKLQRNCRYQLFELGVSLACTPLKMDYSAFLTLLNFTKFCRSRCQNLHLYVH